MNARSRYRPSHKLRRHLHQIPDQFELPGMVTFKGATKPETDRVYKAVLNLRTEGHTVFRAGTGRHAVDGFVIGTKALVAKGEIAWL